MPASSIARRASFSLGRRGFVLRTFAFRVTTGVGGARRTAKNRLFWPILALRVPSGRPAGSPAVREAFEPEAPAAGRSVAAGQPGEAGREEDYDDATTIRCMASCASSGRVYASGGRSRGSGWPRTARAMRTVASTASIGR